MYIYLHKRIKFFKYLNIKINRINLAFFSTICITPVLEIHKIILYLIKVNVNLILVLVFFISNWNIQKILWFFLWSYDNVFHCSLLMQFKTQFCRKNETTWWDELNNEKYHLICSGTYRKFRHLLQWNHTVHEL